uniref:Nuclear pore protein n=1 Tax=Arcella intermedia TaxID=1963864 RepID=A0A6B2KYD6_9EUKA
MEQANQLKNLTKSNQSNIIKNLGELRNTTLTLAEKSALSLDPSVKNRANLLLAKNGIDTEKLDRKMAEVDLKQTESTPFIAHTDLEKFLSQNHEMILISAIEEAKNETEMRFARSCADKLHNEWSSTKMEYLQELGQREYWGDGSQMGRFSARGGRTPSTTKKAPGYPTPNFPNPPHQVQPSPYSLFETVNDKKKREFYGIITRLVEGLKNNQPVNLVEMFLNAITKINLEKPTQTQLLNSWQTLHRIIGRDPLQYPELFLKNPNQARDILLRGVRMYLEDQFTSLMYDEVKSSPDSSHIKKRDIVESFISIKCKREFLQSDNWMTIYYYFRIGQLDEAIRFAKEQNLPSEASILEDFKKHSSSSHFQQSIKTKYMELESQENTSPYKLLMFNIMGICDLSKNFGAIMPKWTCYDFIWQQVIQIGAVGENPKLKASVALRELQDRITKKLGPKTFNQTGKDPLTYFQILLLTLQFERAIDYLMNFEESYQFDAVNFAVTLYYSGLLNQPSLYDNEVDPAQRPNLNYARLLRSFVENLNDPLVGIKYYCTLREERARNECIRDLVIKAGQCTQMFGEVDVETGLRSQGILFAYLRAKEVEEIILITGDAFERMGCHEEALKLYDVAQDFERMLKLLNKQLSRVVTTMDGNSREMVQYAKKRFDRSGAWSDVSEQTSKTFHIMSNLAIFFDLYHYGRFADALRFNQEQLKLLPFRSADVPTYLKEFNSLDDAVRRNFATLLVDTMTCVLRIYEQVKASPHSADLQKLKDSAVAIVTFAGKNQGFYMPGDTHTKLTKMEMQIR